MAFAPRGDAKQMSECVEAHDGTPSLGIRLTLTLPVSKAATARIGMRGYERHQPVHGNDQGRGQPDGHVILGGEAEAEIDQPDKPQLETQNT